MIIIGSKGHAKEIFDSLEHQDDLFFFDDVSHNVPEFLFGKKVITKIDDLLQIIEKKPHYILGLGGPKNRFIVYTKFNGLGGELTSLLSRNALISKHAQLGDGLNVMPFSSISADAIVGKGCLLNSYCSVHHDSILGEFVEVAPGAKILGNCTIGSFTSIGANATILPKISVGSNVVIGAGAVVTKDIPDNCMVAGVPAVIKKVLKPISF